MTIKVIQIYHLEKIWKIIYYSLPSFFIDLRNHINFKKKQEKNNNIIIKNMIQNILKIYKIFGKANLKNLKSYLINKNKRI